MSEIYFWAITSTVVFIVAGTFNFYWFYQKYMANSNHKALTNVCGLFWQCAIPVAFFCWMTITKSTVDVRNGATFALVVLFPIRKLFMVVGPWFISYVAGQNSKLAYNLRHILYPRPIKDGDDTTLNKGIVWVTMAVVDAIFFALAVVCWAWKGLANNRVNVYTHIFSTLPAKLIEAPIGFALLIIITIVFIAMIACFAVIAYKNYKNWGTEKIDEKGNIIKHKTINLVPLLISLEVTFWICKIYLWLFLGFSFILSLSDAIFWLGIHVLGIVVYFIVEAIIARTNQENEPTTSEIDEQD